MLKDHLTFSKFTLFVALSISVIAAYYSVKGLTTIFAGAVTEIIVMGSILEIAKITTTIWLHRYWHLTSVIKKIYLTSAVVILALLTSMGVFGLLSKAHVDQGLVSGDVVQQVAILDERIKTQRENIEIARRAIQQMDAQVEQRLARGTSETGAERSVQIRRQQATERTKLQNEIAAAQIQIAKLNEERAPIASQLRKVEAEVGPIKYIAALIYGDNPDVTTLERAVRWVIIMIVLVFDPLAIILILAANNSMRWDKQMAEDRAAMNIVAPENISNVETRSFTEQEVKALDEANTNVQLADTSTVETTSKSQVSDVPEPSGIGYDDDNKTAERIRYFDNQDYVHYAGKMTSIKALKELRPDLIISAEESHKPVITFDTKFPYEAVLGELFVKVDRVPHSLYKFNGKKWLPVNKTQNATYLQNENYVRYLIKKLEREEYDPEVLTPSEQIEIKNYLEKHSK